MIQHDQIFSLIDKVRSNQLKKRYKVFAIFGFLAFIAIFGFEVKKSKWSREIKETFQSRTVHGGLLNYGTMGKILKESGLVKAIPDKGSHIPATGKRFSKGISRKTFIRMHLKTNTVTKFQIFWANKDQPYTEKESTKINIVPGKSRYECTLPNLKTIRKLRFDPATKPAKICISHIIIENSDFKPILFYNKKILRRLKPVNGIQDISYGPNGLFFSTNSQDPQFEVTIQPIRNIESMIFQRKRQTGEYMYEAKPSGKSAFPSSLVIKPEYFKKDWPLLSIVVEDVDLYHPDSGLITNKTSRGRDWERPAYVSYFEYGQEQFSTLAGLRIHGGKRLQLFSSFRLYFRNEYGASEFKPGILFSRKTEPLKRLVVHHTAWPPGEWYFNNILAYDIARQIGCVVPETKLCELFINGISQGIYFLTPQIHKRQLRSFFGHDNFKIHRFKANASYASEIFYVKHFWRMVHRKEKLKMSKVGESIDIDNLTRHLLSFVFCGTTDFCQGAAALDMSNPEAKLFWINWDMDQSFIDVPKSIFGKELDRDIWEQSAWRMIYKQGAHDCGRTKLFTRLLDEDPEYRRFVVSLTMDLLNHRINSKFLKKRLQFYDQMLSLYGFDDHSILKKYADFLEKRPEFVRNEIQAIFQLGKSLSCEVKGPADIEYEIDTYPEGAGYEGWYFRGDLVKIEIVSSHKKIFSHWLINGHKVHQLSLIHEVKEKTVIEPVFKKLS